MNKILVLLIFSTLAVFSYAQNDTVPKDQAVEVEYFDVVAIYKQFTDGKGGVKLVAIQEKGEILSHDASTGQLTFKSVDGKMYSLNSEQYEYFIYDKEFKVKKKKQPVNYQRKSSGFEVGAGLSCGFTTVLLYLTPDENYLNSITSGKYIPVSIKVVGSKYLNEKSLVGLTSELSFLNSESTHFNIGARYQFMYNPSKSKALYFPAELKYSYGQYKHEYDSNDTTFIDNWNWSYPTSVMTKTTLNSLEINAGQGVSFALKNERSLAIELMLFKQFVLTKAFENKLDVDPRTDFNIYGAKLSIFMNF